MENPFHLFAGMRYYPSDDGSDYIGCFATLQEAIGAVQFEVCSTDWAYVMRQNETGKLAVLATADLDWDTKQVEWSQAAA